MPDGGPDGVSPSWLAEQAAAKINLTLRVRGRRPDGYHDIYSLVAFANVGDRLELAPGGDISLTVAGPFAARLEGENLVLRAAREILRRWPGAAVGRFFLQKNLPVAAGIGGGSADAAAALRLLARANAELFGQGDLGPVAVSLGSDVPVCLAGNAAIMSGRGETLRPLGRLPRIHAVLVNPGMAVATADVFARLHAPPFAAVPDADPGPFGDVVELAGYIRASGNDLTAPACDIAPVIGDVLEALARQHGCLAASMSGSGATCFALFLQQAEAQAAAISLAELKPDWWVVATDLR